MIDLADRIDLHVHGGPDAVPRLLGHLDLARRAAAAGMRAIVLKSHFTLTADVAAVTEQAVGDVRVLGGLTLNNHVGGLNPLAVEAALRMGAAQIWMPTLSSASEPQPLGAPLSAFDAAGRPAPGLLDVLDLVADAGAILGTGHLPANEVAALVPIALGRGVEKLLITHPEHHAVALHDTLLAELARHPVWFEYCAVFRLGEHRTRTEEQLAADLRRADPARVVLSTDLGQPGNPAPVDGFRDYLELLAGLGFSAGELDRMTKDNPAALLGLD